MSTVPEYLTLSKQYSVRIGDPTISEIIRMLNFIVDAELSFVSVKDIDVSDVSMTYDIIRRYTFAKEEDAMIFTLKFKGNIEHD